MRTVSANLHSAHSHMAMLNCQYLLFTQYMLFGAYALLNCGSDHLNSKPHCVASKKSATTVSQLSDEKSMAESFLGYYWSSCKEYTAFWRPAQCLTILSGVVFLAPLSRTEQAVFIKYFQGESLFAEPYLPLRNQGFSLKFYLAHPRIPSPLATTSSLSLPPPL